MNNTGGAPDNVKKFGSKADRRRGDHIRALPLRMAVFLGQMAREDAMVTRSKIVPFPCEV